MYRKQSGSDVFCPENNLVLMDSAQKTIWSDGFCPENNLVLMDSAQKTNWF